MSLSEFEPLSNIGEGVYSSVFKVRRKSDNAVYALKKVRVKHLKPKEQANALTEVRILASVEHPNIIAYKQAFIDDESLCLVLEYASQGDLLSKIRTHQARNTHFTELELRRLARDLAQGLKVLHDLNILHRDLKSANVLLSENGVAKLADMNVAKVAKAGLVYTQTGTPYYASPEVWKDLPYDLKSDIWSLGCVLYEAAALQPPFRANSMPQLYKLVTKGRVKPLPNCYSKELNDFICWFLQVRPVLRPTAAQVLSSPFLTQKPYKGSRLRRAVQRSLDPTRSSPLLRTIYFPQHLRELPELLPPSKYMVAPSSQTPIPKSLGVHSPTPKLLVSDKMLCRPRNSLGNQQKRVLNRLYSKNTIAMQVKALKQELDLHV